MAESEVGSFVSSPLYGSGALGFSASSDLYRRAPVYDEGSKDGIRLYGVPGRTLAAVNPNLNSKDWATVVKFEEHGSWSDTNVSASEEVFLKTVMGIVRSDAKRPMTWGSVLGFEHRTAVPVDDWHHDVGGRRRVVPDVIQFTVKRSVGGHAVGTRVQFNAEGNAHDIRDYEFRAIRDEGLYHTPEALSVGDTISTAWDPYRTTHARQRALVEHSTVVGFVKNAVLAPASANFSTGLSAPVDLKGWLKFYPAGGGVAIWMSNVVAYDMRMDDDEMLDDRVVVKELYHDVYDDFWIGSIANIAIVDGDSAPPRDLWKVDPIAVFRPYAHNGEAGAAWLKPGGDAAEKNVKVAYYTGKAPTASEWFKHWMQYGGSGRPISLRNSFCDLCVAF